MRVIQRKESQTEIWYKKARLVSFVCSIIVGGWSMGHRWEISYINELLMSSMSNRLATKFLGFDYSALIIANNQWPINWLLIDYSLITNWCHRSSISYVWMIIFLVNLVPRSLVDEAEGEIWQSKKICFSWLAAPFESKKLMKNS